MEVGSGNRQERGTINNWCIFSEDLSPEVAKMFCPLVAIRIGSKILKAESTSTLSRWQTSECFVKKDQLHHAVILDKVVMQMRWRSASASDV